MKPMSASQLDAAAERLADLEDEIETLRDRLKQQIAEHGFAPARAEKSKRLIGENYEFTLSTSTTTEIQDAEVEKIAQASNPAFFKQLFRVETRYKLVANAMMLLTRSLPEGAPPRLRQMFARAVVLKESAPRLRIEKIERSASQKPVEAIAS